VLEAAAKAVVVGQAQEWAAAPAHALALGLAPVPFQSARRRPALAVPGARWLSTR
jgi:hypothetical protein